jgi:hypothetical protein
VEEKTSKAGWVLAGIGTVLFGVFIFYLYNPRWFGERFVHFDGAIKHLTPLGPDRVLVIEHVQTGGGEDGPTTVGDRWRIVEVATGKNLVGPHFIDPIRWAAVQDDQLLMMAHRDLQVRGFDNRLVANLAAFKGATNLRPDPNSVTLGDDGRITAMSDDGRLYLLDVKTLNATPVAERGRSGGSRSLSSANVRGQDFKGRPRAQLNGKGPDYLEPEWVADPQTGRPIQAADGLLMLHYQRMHDSPAGRGPILSAVNADGVEIWRYVVPFEHLFMVAVMGNQLVLGLNERSELGPGWLRVIDLTTGQERWRMSL